MGRSKASIDLICDWFMNKDSKLTMQFLFDNYYLLE